MSIKLHDYSKKAEWGDGPWQAEPDRKDWVDEATGYPCMAIRQPSMGHWCGYVGVPEGHKFYGKEYSKCVHGDACPNKKEENEESGWFYCDHRPEGALEVHGGITYSDFCGKFICHEPKEGETDKVYWFGFDCAHFMDEIPAMTAMRKPGGILHETAQAFPDAHKADTYKTLTYVEAECASLAKQLAAVT